MTDSSNKGKLFVITNLNCIKIANALERVKNGLQIITNYERIANVINLVQKSECCIDAEDLADDIEDGGFGGGGDYKSEHTLAPRIIPVSYKPKSGDTIKIPTVGEFGVFAVEYPSEYDIDDRFASLVIGPFHREFGEIVEINIGPEVSEELPEERHRNPKKYIKAFHNFGFSLADDYEDRFEVPVFSAVEIANAIVKQHKADFYELHPLFPNSSPFVALVFSAGMIEELLTEIAKLDFTIGCIVSYRNMF